MILIRYSNQGNLLDVETPNGNFKAEIIEKPFYDPNKKISSKKY